MQSSLQYCERYTGCAGNVEVTLCSLPGTGHVLYVNPLDFDVPASAWAMFTSSHAVMATATLKLYSAGDE